MSAEPGMARLRYRAFDALAVGDTLTVRVAVTAKDALQQTVTLVCTGLNQDSTAAIDGEAPGQPLTEKVDHPAHQLSWLLEQAKPLGAIRVAVVHPCDALSLGGALDARVAGLIDPVLVAPRAKLQAVAAQAGLDLTGIAIEDVPHSHAAAARAAELAARGEVDALMKGSLHTDELLSAVLSPAAGLRTKRRLSHCFVMQTPAYPRPFIITDAAINIAPTLEHKADIVRNAITLAQAIGVATPRVAILAAVETVNPAMPATLDAAALCKMAERGQIQGAVLDGPLAFDNAVSAAAAHTKGIVSPVAGQADVLVVPDLESGNMLAKQLEYMGDAATAGIVLGAKLPIVLTSRADSRATRTASCAVAVLLAQHYRVAPP
jgi:phosphotransacetylase